MDRRTALRKTSWMLKSTLLAPGLLSAIQACREAVQEEGPLLVLSSSQLKLVSALADTIIPPTDTPSASETAVPQFLDLLLQDVFDDEVKQKFLTGLREFDQECLSVTDSNYLDLSAAEQRSYLEQVDAEVMTATYQDEVPFYYSFKHLVTMIYFSSEAGVKQNLQYRPIPGPFKGDMEYNPGEKITLGNHM